jgi:hypothetical protein
VQQLEERFFQGGIAIAGPEIEDFGPFAAKGSVSTSLQFIDGEELGGGARHDERERVLRSRGGEACEDFFATLIGEEEFPAEAIATVENRRRGRRNFQAVAIGANEGTAAHVALDEPLGFEFGVGIGNGGAVHAESKSELAASGYAITGMQIAGMDQGTELVAELDIERDVAFGLKV